LVPEFEAPEYLRRKCQEMQAAASSLGLGYRKARLEVSVHQRLLDHLRANLDRFRSEGAIDEIRTSDRATIPTLIFEDEGFNARLAEELRPLHEAWAGRPLTVSQCYGIRCYQRGTFLYKHLDRQPHLVSSTICVDHSLRAPWPLSIDDVEGGVSQIDQAPGDLVFYEGARLPHGRPYPLDGDFYAGIFLHYYPTPGL
jgi:prolyl 4-hydroxylase